MGLFKHTYLSHGPAVQDSGKRFYLWATTTTTHISHITKLQLLLLFFASHNTSVRYDMIWYEVMKICTRRQTWDGYNWLFNHIVWYKLCKLCVSVYGRGGLYDLIDISDVHAYTYKLLLLLLFLLTCTDIMCASVGFFYRTFSLSPKSVINSVLKHAKSLFMVRLHSHSLFLCLFVCVCVSFCFLFLFWGAICFLSFDPLMSSYQHGQWHCSHLTYG